MQSLNGTKTAKKGLPVGFRIITDGFSIKVNPEVLHEYAEQHGLCHLSYSLVRACYLRDLRAGLVH